MYANRITVLGLAVAILTLGSCGDDPVPDQVPDPGTESRPMSGPSGGSDSRPGPEGPASRPKTAADVPGLPALTGDREADKQTILTALRETKAELLEVQNSYNAHIATGKAPSEAEVERIGRLAAKLQERIRALDELRRKIGS